MQKHKTLLLCNLVFKDNLLRTCCDLQWCQTQPQCAHRRQKHLSKGQTFQQNPHFISFILKVWTYFPREQHMTSSFSNARGGGCNCPRLPPSGRLCLWWNWSCQQIELDVVSQQRAFVNRRCSDVTLIADVTVATAVTLIADVTVAAAAVTDVTDVSFRTLDLSFNLQHKRNASAFDSWVHFCKLEIRS